MLENLVINDQFREALDILNNTSDHLFITGNAGTGKSTLLNLFREQSEKSVVVLAPTGVAAVNVTGETIHSFFKFKPNITPEDARKTAKKHRNDKIYHALETLIIDEISMVRADLFDCMDNFLRVARGNHYPFGGVQMVMIGDLHQLPPVVTTEERGAIAEMYSSPYFFSSEVFPFLLQSLTPRFRLIELMKIFRQSDNRFISILNNVRNKTMTPRDLSDINERLLPDGKYPDDHIVLTTTNEQADEINQEHMKNLPGETTMYYSSIVGDFPYKSLPTSELLSLKVGARVMLLNNDREDRWINGTIGTVTVTESDYCMVAIDGGAEVRVDSFSWTMYRSVFNEDTQSIEHQEAGSFKQIPLRLAWAITIHKSQGKTFDKVVVDLGRGTFAHGQTYVALSRATSLEGLKLAAPLQERHIIMDTRIVSFLNMLKKELGTSIEI